MRLLLDELYPQAIAEQLRRRGHDVVSVHDRPGLEGASDEELLALAAEERRALLTANVRDFTALLDDWLRERRDHCGLLFTSDRGMPRTRDDIGRYVKVLDELLTARPEEDALRNNALWMSHRGP